MKTFQLDTTIVNMMVAELGKSGLFGSLDEDSLGQIARASVLNEYQPDEMIVHMHAPSYVCFMILKGEVAILYQAQPDQEILELGRRKPYDLIGEIGLLLNQPRSATVKAIKKTLMLTFGSSVFDYMFQRIPGFGRSLSQLLATRLRELSLGGLLPSQQGKAVCPPPHLIQKLPLEFILRYRMLPLLVEGHELSIGVVTDPGQTELRVLHQFFPEMQLKLVYIHDELIDLILQGMDEWFSCWQNDRLLL